LKEDKIFDEIVFIFLLLIAAIAIAAAAAVFRCEESKREQIQIKK
jgi:uncharacterized membrane protein YkvI